ncbi:glycoside hydrolase family 18 protein [Cylindrobasidium torrendii FP15055 ss-10]|uniref:Glycoside hydrolase family 18 protein n=1 Tax=Cylindrobasidium torrendii FP15055 ss-10 TaxID=1314674 RepID=A0A0D7B047_9AGAR|nr:glycoside hydrolase family 18 protein [Cylindrobasidium torrendii FP15055 ss-10]
MLFSTLLTVVASALSLCLPASASPITSSLSPKAREVLQRATVQEAPHFVVYGDKSTTKWGAPDVADIEGFNVFALSFLLTAGPWDKAYEWTTMTADERTAAKAEYAAAGIKLVVSAFGSSDVPTSANYDPVALAQTMAAWVKTWELDGIDVDYEDFNAFAAGTAENWLISFTTELRNQLPSGEFIITHAPVAPWFTPSIYSGGGYLKVHNAVGNAIDWYNIQFYNQGTAEYTTCDGLLNKSSDTWPETSVFEIAGNGVDVSKLVIGKPGTTGDANNGFMTASDLAVCLQEAKGKGWNGGAMAWQYPNADSSWIKTVRSLSWPV